MLRNSLSGDIERRAMIDRRANKWQAQGDIDCFAKRKTLDGNHRLVMITRDDGVELAPRSAQVNRVGREWSAHVNSLGHATRFDGRYHF